MSAIGPGDFVEYIDDSPHPITGTPSSLLKIGQVYRVLFVGPAIHPLTDEPCVFVFPPEMLMYGMRYSGTYIWRFRPIYRPDAQLIADLLTGVPAEPELVTA